MTTDLNKIVMDLATCITPRDPVTLSDRGGDVARGGLVFDPSGVYPRQVSFTAGQNEGVSR